MMSPSSSTLSKTTLAHFERLRRHGEKIRWLAVLEGSVWFLATCLVALGATYLLDRGLDLGVGVRRLLLVAALVAIGRSLLRHLVAPVRVPRDLLSLAAATDHAVGGPDRTHLTQNVGTLLSLEPRLAVPGEDPRELLERAVRTSHEQLAAYDFDAVLDTERAGKRATWVGVLILIPAFLILAHPELAGLWFRRLVLGSDDRWPRETWLEVEGFVGDRRVVAEREAIELRVFAREGSVVPESVEIRYRLDDGPSERTLLTRFGPNDFRVRLPGVERTVEFWVQGGDDDKGPLWLDARARPRLVEFELRAQLPDAGIDETLQFEEVEKDLAFLTGSRLTLRCRADQPVRRLELPPETSTGIEQTLVEERVNTLTWVHATRRSLTLTVTSVETGLESRPRVLGIGVIEDTAPRVTLEIDGVRDRVTPTATVPIRLLSRDDFGVTDLRFEVRHGATPRLSDTAAAQDVTLFLSAEGAELATSVERRQNLEITDLRVTAGSFAQVLGTSKDGCHLGRQTGRSRPVLLRIVEPSQLRQEITLRLEGVRGAFRKSWNGSRELVDALQGESAPPADDLLRRHRLLEQRVWSTQRVFQSSAREMRLNKLIEAEAHALLEREVTDPLTRLYEGKVREQRQDYERFAQGSAVPRNDLLERQIAINAEMKRILDAMQRWDSFVDLVNQLDEIILLQRNARRETLGDVGKENEDDK